MKTSKILLPLVLCVFLAAPAFAGPPVIDPVPVNLDEPDGFYDYRNYGTFSHVFAGGSEGRSGAYFHISVGVVPGGDLPDYDAVQQVKAEHVQTDTEFWLLRDENCTNWLTKDIQYYDLLLRPQSWMFHGTWKFHMTYKVDGITHLQTIEKQMTDTENFPMKPSHILVTESEGFFLVSWSGIGIPRWPGPDYRIRVFDNLGCVLTECRMDEVAGTYDPDNNVVTCRIPDTYRNHSIRLENRVRGPGYWSRAIQYMTLF